MLIRNTCRRSSTSVLSFLASEGSTGRVFWISRNGALSMDFGRWVLGVGCWVLGVWLSWDANVSVFNYGVVPMGGFCL